MFVDFVAAGIDPQKCDALRPERGEGARRAVRAAGHDHAGRLAGALALLQGDPGEHHRPRPGAVRLPRLPGAADRRRDPLQGQPRAGGRGPGAAPRAGPRRSSGASTSTTATSSPSRSRSSPRPPRSSAPTAGRCRRATGTPSTWARTRRSTRKKIMGAVTDPARKRRQDPGNPEVCGIFYLHRVYSDARHHRLGGPELPDGRDRLRRLQEEAARKLLPAQEKMRERREALLARPGDVDELVQLGTRKARDGGGADDGAGPAGHEAHAGVAWEPHERGRSPDGEAQPDDARRRAQGQADEPAPERAGGPGGPSFSRPPRQDSPQGQADEPAPERAGGPGGRTHRPPRQDRPRRSASGCRRCARVSRPSRVRST